MKKSTFNQLNRWVIEKWPQVIRLERSMNEVREKYEEVMQMVGSFVQEEHADLMLGKIRVSDNGGNISFTKENWFSQYPSWPTGIYLGNISLESLTAENAESPYACIWLSVNKSDAKFNLHRIREKLRKIAEARFEHRINKGIFEDEDIRTALCYWFPESREGLLAMLLDDELAFVECLTSHVSNLSTLIPALEEMFRNKRGG